MRTLRLDDLVRHWRRLLAVAEAEGASSASLRRSLQALDAAVASGNVNDMSARLAEVRVCGHALEQLLRTEILGAMTERVEVFGPDGNMQSFESADEAHRHALREQLHGGRIEITDEFGTVTVEQIVRTNYPASLYTDFVLEPFQPSEAEAFDIAVIQGQELTTSMGVEAFLAQPQVREAAAGGELALRYKRPSADSPGWILEAWHGEKLVSMAPAPEFGDAYLAIGDEIEDHLRGDGDLP